VVALVFRDVAAPTIDHSEFGYEMGWVARSITLGRGFSAPFLPITGPTALVPPLYPYLLAGVFRLFGLYTPLAAFVILSINTLFSALTCIPIYLTVKQALDSRIARLAACAWVVYPFSVYFSADRVWDYALTALLFSSCFCWLQNLHRHRTLTWMGFGLLYGVAALSNPSILSLLPFFLLLAMFRARRAKQRWFVNGLVAALAVCSVCVPWMIRNGRALHTGPTLRDGFWLEFYAGNNGDTFESNVAWAHPASNPLEMDKFVDMGEIPYMKANEVMAKNFIHRHPGFVAVATLRRIVRYWTAFWSLSPRYLHKEPTDIPNIFFCTTLTILMLHGLKRWGRVSWNAIAPYAMAVVIFPLPYYLTHASPDYRQPIEPIVAMLVTIGIFGPGRRQPV
jgi:4-amino-4-deoxy-L-arabinose transferase-like glycosyltransferase